MKVTEKKYKVGERAWIINLWSDDNHFVQKEIVSDFAERINLSGGFDYMIEDIGKNLKDGYKCSEFDLFENPESEDAQKAMSLYIAKKNKREEIQRKEREEEEKY